MSSPTVYLVHALEQDAAGPRVVGLGTCAAPVQQVDFRKPPMVVLLVDREAVADDDTGHDRNAVLDDDVLVALGALDAATGREVATVLERAADTLERREQYGATVAPSRAFTVLVPTTQTEAELELGVEDVASSARVVLSWSPNGGRSRRFALDGVAAKELASRVTRMSDKVRRALGA
jgi:hypothetical protein